MSTVLQQPEGAEHLGLQLHPLICLQPPSAPHHSRLTQLSLPGMLPHATLTGRSCVASFHCWLGLVFIGWLPEPTSAWRPRLNFLLGDRLSALSLVPQIKA